MRSEETDVFRDDTCMFIVVVYDRMEVFAARSVLIRTQFARFPFGNVEIFHD